MGLGPTTILRNTTMLGQGPTYVLLLCLFSLNSLALPSDRTQPIELLADTIELDANTQTGIYKGHIRFSQGSAHMEADEATTTTDKSNHLIYAEASAPHPPFAHFWTQQHEKESALHAYAQKIQYFPDKHLIVLTGDAKIIQDNNQINAPVIRFDLLDRRMLTEKTPTSRTQILFHTDAHHANTLSAPFKKSV